VQDSNSSRHDLPPIRLDFADINPEVAQAAHDLILSRPELRESILQSLRALRAAPPTIEDQIAEYLDDPSISEDELAEAEAFIKDTAPIFMGRYSELSRADKKFLVGLRIRP
jgi:hypothetical protein